MEMPVNKSIPSAPEEEVLVAEATEKVSILKSDQDQEEKQFFCFSKDFAFCPPKGLIAEWFTYCLLLLTAWTVGFISFGKLSVPGNGQVLFSVNEGAFFSLLIVITVALFIGWLMYLVSKINSLNNQCQCQLYF